MIDGLPVLDAVVHACNMDAVNYANRFAAPLCDLVYGSVPATARPGYAPTRAQFYRDWSIKGAAKQVYVETRSAHILLQGRVVQPGKSD
jgi:hypothetical protein